MENKQIKILHLCEHFGGKEASLHGVARTFQWWLPLFDVEKFKVILCSRKGFDKAAKQMEESGIKPLYLGYGKMDPRNLFKLFSILKREKVDIIHAHGFGACMWGRIAGHIKKIPVVIHGRANYGKIPLVMYPVERTLGPLTKYALAVSESTADFMIKKRYVPQGNVKVLYSGIILDKIKKADEKWIHDFRSSNGITGSQKIIGIVGRLVSHKGHMDAFCALKKVRETFPETKLWILGDGDYEPQLKKWVIENNYEDHVKFLGYRNDVINIIQCFNLQLFPSYMEGTPNTLYEAMAVGNAVVASKCDGQKEILNDSEDALLYDCGDIETMAAHLKVVLNDEDLKKRLEDSVLHKIQKFDGKKCIKFLEAYYEDILKDCHES